MWPLLIIFTQVINSYSANGILTYEPSTATSSYRATEETGISWQAILKSAMFQTISKYTGFSPSLDVKMEADRLLWEKLDGAKYTRKILKPGEEEERLKTGVLIDMSRENGHLEFKQVDRSLYRSIPQDHRLLALWRVKIVDTNNFLIQIKIPDEQPTEYLYEYNQNEGLKEVNIKNWEYSRKQNKNNTWKTGDRKMYSSTSEIYSETRYPPKSLRYNEPRRQQYNDNRHKSRDRQSYRYQKVTPRTYLNKPAAQYFTVVGYQTPPPPSSEYTWKQASYYYRNTQTTNLPEFKQDTDYDGFVPSLGPTGNPPLYPAGESAPVSYKEYKQSVRYFPPYIPEAQVPQKPYPITYFKPSTQFVQYSELDPFYSSNGTNEYSYQPPTEIPILTQNVAQYPQFLYNTPPTSAISVQVPPVAPGISLYDIAINTIKHANVSIESTEKENIIQPTVTSYIYDYIEQTDDSNETELTQQTGTTEVPSPIIEDSNSSSKSRVKNSLRDSNKNLNTGQDSYDYAPLYIQWGEKIKPNGNKMRTSTPKTSQKEYQNDETPESKSTKRPETMTTEKNSNETIETNQSLSKPSEKKKPLQKQHLSLKKQNDTSEVLNKLNHYHNSNSSKNLHSLIEHNTTTDAKNKTTSENVTQKSPEEVVRDLTSLGFQNSTTESENLRNTNVKQVVKEDLYSDDNQLQSTEPVSVIVNRISQSISYKTSEGHTGSLKLLPDKT